MRRIRKPTRSRRGLVLIAALVCLLVSMAIVGSMLQGAIRARRQLHTERDLRQTELLLQAGFERSVAKLAADADFAGDAWELSAEGIIGRGAGRVTTEINRANDGNDSTWQIHVVAEYPLGRDFPIRRSQSFTVPANAFSNVPSLEE